MSPALLATVVLWGASVAGTDAGGLQSRASIAEADETIRCRSIADDPPRVWTFSRRGTTWRIVHQREGHARRAALVLPSPTVTQTERTIHVRARTANGGIDLTLDGPWSRATLDAYVNYELEVNVDVSLTPDIDEISTEAPTGVACVHSL